MALDELQHFLTVQVVTVVVTIVFNFTRPGGSVDQFTADAILRIPAAFKWYQDKQLC